MKSLSSIKEEFGFNNFSNFKWQQLICSLPPSWKNIIKDTDIADNLLLPNHHLIKINTLLGIAKLNSRQLYPLLVYTHPFTPTSQEYNILCLNKKLLCFKNRLNIIQKLWNDLPLFFKNVFTLFDLTPGCLFRFPCRIKATFSTKSLAFNI